MELIVETISITLTVNEANYVLQSLGMRPFTEVVDLIMKIRGQAEAEIKAHQEPVPATIEPDHA
jgi:hypothetical protein